MSWRSSNRRQWVGYLAALVAVALVSALIGVVLQRITIANISMLYLIAVLVTAIAFGRGPAILASVAAFLIFDWFFVLPRHTFTIADPAEWVALLLFLLTAVVTGQLAARERERATEAERREHEAIILGAITQLMSGPDLAQGLQAVAARLRQEFHLPTVTITLDERAAQHSGSADDHHAADGEHLGRSAYHRLQTIPVPVQDGSAATITLFADSERQLTARETRLLAAVAAHLGGTIERARLRQEATEAESLRRTDELKNALLSAVSHDLRTPLASIIASAGSLRQHDVAWTEEERQEFAEAIEVQAQRLNRIVGNLLDLSRIEGGSLRPERAWHDLGTLIYEVLGRLRPLTARHHLAVEIPEELPPVYLDYVQIDQVLSNLIENAVKYAPPDTKVWITVRQDGPEVIVQVADRGPGIPAAALPQLFTRFFRIEGKGARPKGLGLGLAVAKGLVEAHGGRIWARNRLDGGAYFAFTLPLTPVLGSAGDRQALAAGSVAREQEG